MTQTIELPILNFKAQQAIFDDPTRYKIVAKGRRFGLTRGAAHDFILCALQKKFKQGLWVDTINSNIERYVERYFMPALHKLPSHMYNWRKQQKILEINGRFIDFRSVDKPENIEGFGYDKVFLNEAGIILRDEYLWNNAVRPMLWDFKPSVVIGGTPKGRGVFYQLYQYGLSEDEEDYKSFHFSSFDNPYLPQEVLKEDMKKMPEAVIKQEIYAEFVDDAGVVFRNIRDIAISHFQPPRPGHDYVLGVDLAKYQDFTVIAVYDVGTHEQVYQDRFKNYDWVFQRKKIKEVSKHFNGATVYLDATGVGDPVNDELTADGVPVIPIKFTNEIKKQLIEKIVLWNDLKRFKILPIAESINEFSQFTYEVTAHGNIRYEAPVGLNDDIVMAHALAIHSMYDTTKVGEPRERSPLSQLFRAQSQHLEENWDQYDYEEYPEQG